MSNSKCAACDVRLKAGEVYFCAACAVEHETAMAVTRKTMRYCEMCDIFMHPSVCKACGMATVIAAMLILLLLPSLASAQVSSQLEKPRLSSATWALIGGNVADAVSTEIAVRRVGVKEGNPIMGQSTAQRLAVKAAGTAAAVWMVKKLEQRHPRTAKIVGYSLGGVLGVVAAHNFRMGQ